MDLGKFISEGKKSIAQYRPPLSYELVGRRYNFLMDDGYDYQLSFIDEKTLEWGWKGETGKAEYLCAKGDETTFLLTYALEGRELRENHTWVIDLEQWLVTRIVSVVGENPRYPFVIKPKYEFGMIEREGVPYSVYPRHGFTSDMVGNVVQWNYGMMETVHIYYCTDFYRITYPPENEATRTINEAVESLPSSDEPTAYIKIKDGIYLFSLTESNSEKLLGDRMQLRSNTMCMLQNYRRVYQVGRTFGTDTRSGEVKSLHLMFGAFGRIRTGEEKFEKFLNDPNPFLV